MTSCCQPKPEPQSCCDTKINTSSEDNVHDTVRQYYGQELSTKDDCQTGVNCLMDDVMPRHIREAMALVHDDVTMK